MPAPDGFAKLFLVIREIPNYAQGLVERVDRDAFRGGRVIQIKQKLAAHFGHVGAIRVEIIQKDDRRRDRFLAAPVLAVRYFAFGEPLHRAGGRCAAYREGGDALRPTLVEQREVAGGQILDRLSVGAHDHVHLDEARVDANRARFLRPERDGGYRDGE